MWYFLQQIKLIIFVWNGGGPKEKNKKSREKPLININLMLKINKY